VLKKILCAIALTAAALPASAAELSSDEWQWSLGIYAYLPDINGTTHFADLTGGNGATLEIEDILENLEFTAMAALSVKRGSWGAFTDAVYMSIGSTDEKASSFSVGGRGVPAGADANVSLDMKGFVWTFGGSYTVNNDADQALDLLYGARVIDIEQSIQWQLSGNVASIPVGSRSGSLTAELQNWDVIVGFRGRPTFGASGKWSMPYYGDIGTGESDFTWQAMIGLGYSFGWGDVQASWRYLEYTLESDSAVQSLSFNGPLLAAVFRW
jgi:hypothetical protein